MLVRNCADCEITEDRNGQRITDKLSLTANEHDLGKNIEQYFVRHDILTPTVSVCK